MSEIIFLRLREDFFKIFLSSFTSFSNTNYLYLLKTVEMSEGMWYNIPCICIF